MRTRVDPTRSITVRRAFRVGLRRSFAKLRGELVQRSGLTFNAFCPTGPGGGVDPTCSPGGLAVTKTPEFKRWFGGSKVTDARGRPQLTSESGLSSDDNGDPVVVYHGNPRGEVTEFKKEWTEKRPEDMHFGPGFYFTEDADAGKMYAEGATGSSAKGKPAVGKYFLKSLKPFDADKMAIDPSKLPQVDRAAVRSAMVQKAFAEEGRSEAVAIGRAFDAGEVRLKYTELTNSAGVGGYGASKAGLQKVLRDMGHDSITVIGPDVPGGKPGGNRFWVVFEPTQIKSVTAKKFDPNDPVTINDRSEEAEKFDEWLRKRVDHYFLSTEEQEKWGRFIGGGYRKGIDRTTVDAKQSREVARMMFGKAVAVEQIRFLRTQAMAEVRGATRSFRTVARRVLVEGLTTGKDVTAKLVKVLDVTRARAETIANTEFSRAFAEGQLDAMENLGVDEVGVEVEWSTADDPCPQCSDMEGATFTVEEARGLLPRHPNCRCAWTPTVPESEGQKAEREATRNIRGCGCHLERFDVLLNVFCPTGPGGGVDPTCSPGGGGSYELDEDEREYYAKRSQEELTSLRAKAEQDGFVELFHGTSAKYLEAITVEGLTGGKGIGASGPEGERFRHSGRETSTYLTADQLAARTYGRFAGGHTDSDPVLLKVRIPKEFIDKLYLDEHDSSSLRFTDKIPASWLSKVD